MGELHLQEVTVTGCVLGSAERFDLAEESKSTPTRLIGHTSELAKYAAAGYPVTIRGTLDESTDPATITIIFAKAHSIPMARLARAFSNSSNWKSERDVKNGIKYAHPGYLVAAAVDSEPLDPDFVDENGSVTLRSLEIPPDIYPNSNFAGGTFGIFVNSNIENQESCEQFGSNDPEFISSQIIAGVRYTTRIRGSIAGGGRYVIENSFHTFEHGLCYGVQFEYYVSNPRIADQGCMTPVLTEKDKQHIVELLIGKISFFQPSPAVVRTESQAVPEVTSFESSADAFVRMVNHGNVNFTWTTWGADYVQLSTVCTAQVASGELSLFGGGVGKDCGSGQAFSSSPANQSPDSTAEIEAEHFSHLDTIPITITITPFSHSKAYPGSSKSLTLNVVPFE
jgi:hypothetical protein